MEIAVLEGSPNRKGSSNLLAAEFIRGVKESGHSVRVVDAAYGDSSLYRLYLKVPACRRRM